MPRNNFWLCDTSDNVYVVTAPDGLAAGQAAGEVTAIEQIPPKHKICRRAIPRDAPVVRYGAPIALASREISAGEHVNAANTRDNPVLPWLELQRYRIGGAAIPSAPVVQQPRFWLGYPGSRGHPPATRNNLLIAASVKCSSGAVRRATERIRRTLLPSYPNVDRVVGFEIDWGCGCAISTPRAEITQRQFNNVVRHAAFGAAAIAELGCEKNERRRIFPGETPPAVTGVNLPLLDQGPAVIRIQDEGSIESTVSALCEWAARVLPELNRRRRVALPVGQLCVALQCGGSDALSGITANPVVGRLADLLVWHGARPFFTETSEVVAGAPQLLDRCASTAVGEQLIGEILWYRAYLQSGGADFEGNPTPGNREGGLLNIYEKSLGSIAKTGRTAIVGVAQVGALLGNVPGLWFMGGPANDFKGMTAQFASGAALGVMTTGQGRPSDLPGCPWIMVASNSRLAQRMWDGIDFDAGVLLDDTCTIDDLAARLFDELLAVASGKLTVGEKYQYENVFSLFSPDVVT